VVNYYPQKTEQELLDILDSIQKRASTGVVAFYTAAGVQQQRSFQGAARPSTEILRILYSLHLLLPGTYADPYASRIRRTRASYTF
jgi:hypothetical protein